ncbi:MAG TPA: DUF2934 domain-containing protein [Terriglobales bacterium]|nr:DUF2934 domain-containing protein [Terriglobales bacterium]
MRTTTIEHKEKIRQRAYEIYQTRLASGQEEEGDALSDWLQAEQEVEEAPSPGPEYGTL